MMTGTLYVIGVGPGDPELLTLKAARILRDIPCICVPKGRQEGSSLALSIVEKTIDIKDKEIIEAHFPMRKTRGQRTEHREQNTATSTHPSPCKGEGKGGGNSLYSDNCELDTKWNETVEIVLSMLTRGIDMAFITIGDPAIYSTFFYLYDRLLELNPDLNIEIIPGVSSINAAASRAGISLGLADEKIAVIPATYADNLKEILEGFDTIVLMKVHRVFDKILKTLEEMNLLNNSIYISRAGMKDERIFKDLRDMKEEDLNYFSMVIIRK